MTGSNFNYALKFADGRLICFQRYSFSGKNTAAWGNIYVLNNLYTISDYAVPFTAPPTLSATYLNLTDSGWDGWLVRTADTAATAQHPCQFAVARPTTASGAVGAIDIVAYGFWK